MSFDREFFSEASEQERGFPGWEQHYIQLQPGRFAGSIERLTLPGVSIVRERINLATEQTVRPPPGDVIFTRALRSGLSFRANGASSSSDCFAVARGGEEIHAVVGQDCDLLIASLPADRLCSVDGAGVRFAPIQPLADAAFGWLLALLAAYGTLEGSVEAARVLADLVADRLDHIGYHVGLMAEKPGGQGGSDYLIYRRARDLVESEPEDVHSVASLSARLSVTPASLRQAFVAVVELGPGTWLRHRRLNAARRDLLKSEETGLTVAEIAMKWGFWHLGRFSAYYAQLFEETPSQTQRGRSAVIAGAQAGSN